MRGADGLRWDAVPLRIEPALGQLSENGTEPPASLSRKESWNVLQEHVSWSNQANDSHELEEQPGSTGVDSGLLSGVAEILAWESSEHEVDGSDVRFGKGGLRDGGDVPEVGGGGPMPGEHPTGVGVDLGLCDDLEARSLDAEVQAADAREQGQGSGPHGSNTSTTTSVGAASGSGANRSPCAVLRRRSPTAHLTRASAMRA